MGRGRAKAKQVKVARQLKYNSGGTDLDRLRAELGVVTDQQDSESEAAYAELADRYSDDGDDSDEEDEDEDEDDLDEGPGEMGMADGTARQNGNAPARMNGTSGT